jgi:hypothetical protein
MFTAETSANADQPTATKTTTDSQTAYPFRLLQDERVLGTFPVARMRRPLGKVASFLFVTDSRVIYSAEAKALASSSTHLKEYQVQTVTGVEVGRHRGLDAIGAAAAVGATLNFLILVILASLAGSSGSSGSSYFYSSNPFASLAPVFGFLAVVSLVVGAVAVIIMARSTAEIRVVGPGESKSLAHGGDLAGLIVTFVLLLIFGPLVGLAAIVWAILRELGMFQATDAQLYADTKNVDHISYEVGALILDVQARGKLAGQN